MILETQKELPEWKRENAEGKAFVLMIDFPISDFPQQRYNQFMYRNIYLDVKRKLKTNRRNYFGGNSSKKQTPC